jgi:hypothetical protein
MVAGMRRKDYAAFSPVVPALVAGTHVFIAAMARKT